MIEKKLKIETTADGKYHWIVYPETYNRVGTALHIDKNIFKNLDFHQQLYLKDYKMYFTNNLEIEVYCKNYLEQNNVKILYEQKSDNFKEELVSEIKTYIMKDCNTGFYKIGKSINPKLRERTLQSEKPTIKIIKVFDKNIEKNLHNTYKDFRVRGEWFDLNNIQINYICTHY
jgi:hypothetical protein